MVSVENCEEIFSAYRQINEKTDTLFTILVYDLSVSELLNNIEHRLQFCKEIKNTKKKAIICSRLFNFKEYLSQIDPNQKIDSIYLIEESTNEIKLTANMKQLLHEYKIDNFIFKYDYSFQIDYLLALFTDLNFKQVIYIKNNEYTHFLVNTTKKKIIFHKESKNFDIVEYVNSNIKEKCLIHGLSSTLKYLKIDPHWVFTCKLTDEQIFKLFKDDEMAKIHSELDKYLSWIQNSQMMHRLVFGKDIEKKIAQKSLQLLYCSPVIYEKVIKRLPKEHYSSNFKIYKIETISKGDPGDRLESSFSGVLGVTYY